MPLSYIKNSLFLHIVLFIFAVVVGYGSLRVAREGIIAYRERAAHQEKIQSLTEKKHTLEKELARMLAPGVEEREAKERLNLKLPGEHVVVVLPDALKVQQSPYTKGWWPWVRAWFSEAD